jgi:hypothetical protein
MVIIVVINGDGSGGQIEVTIGGGHIELTDDG